MTDLDLVYNSPQDKLLVMLLERISALEDIISKQGETISKLLLKSTSNVFSIMLTTHIKYHPDENGDIIRVLTFEEFKTAISELKAVMNEQVQCHNLYSTSRNGTHYSELIIHTTEHWLLCDIQAKLRGVEYLDKRTIIMERPMDVIKGTRRLNRFNIVV